jgi:hypothetical protein
MSAHVVSFLEQTKSPRRSSAIREKQNGDDSAHVSFLEQTKTMSARGA